MICRPRRCRNCPLCRASLAEFTGVTGCIVTYLRSGLSLVQTTNSSSLAATHSGSSTQWYKKHLTDNNCHQSCISSRSAVCETVFSSHTPVYCSEWIHTVCKHYVSLKGQYHLLNIHLRSSDTVCRCVSHKNV